MHGSFAEATWSAGKGLARGRLRRGCSAVGAVVLALGFLTTSPSASASPPSPFAFGPVAAISGSGASGVEVATGRNGDAVAVFTRPVGDVSSGTLVLEAASRPARGSWSSPTPVATGLVGDVDVAMGPRGEALAVWTRRLETSSVIESATRPARGGWSSPSTLADGGNLFVGRAQVAIGNRGQAVAVWQRPTGFLASTVEAAVRSLDGGWSAPQTLGESNGQRVRLAVNDHGDAVAAWEKTDWSTGGYFVVAATRPAEGAWSLPSQLSAEAGAYGPRVALSNRDEAVVVWFRLGPSGSVVEAATGWIDGHWSPPVVINNAWASWPDVAVSDRGEAVVTWLGSTGTDVAVEVTERSPRGDWSPVQRIGSTPTSMAVSRVGITRKGDAIVAWPQWTSSGGVIEAATRAKRRAWSPPNLIGRTGGLLFEAQLAVGDRGAAVIAWWRDAAGGSVVEATVAD